MTPRWAELKSWSRSAVELPFHRNWTPRETDLVREPRAMVTIGWSFSLRICGCCLNLWETADFSRRFRKRPQLNSGCAGGMPGPTGLLSRLPQGFFPSTDGAPGAAAGSFATEQQAHRSIEPRGTRCQRRRLRIGFEHVGWRINLHGFQGHRLGVAGRPSVRSPSSLSPGLVPNQPTYAPAA